MGILLDENSEIAQLVINMQISKMLSDNNVTIHFQGIKLGMLVPYKKDSLGFLYNFNL